MDMEHIITNRNAIEPNRNDWIESTRLSRDFEFGTNIFPPNLPNCVFVWNDRIPMTVNAEWFRMSVVNSHQEIDENRDEKKRLFKNLIRFSGDLQRVYMYIYTNSDWLTFRPNHNILYCMNSRQVTLRLRRLCRQYRQIISLICSIRIEKV